MPVQHKIINCTGIMFFNILIFFQLVKKLSLQKEKGWGQAGKLERAEPASNGIECPATPCAARFAASEARTFVPLCGTKVTAFLKAVRKVRPGLF